MDSKGHLNGIHNMDSIYVVSAGLAGAEGEQAGWLAGWQATRHSWLAIICFPDIRDIVAIIFPHT